MLGTVNGTASKLSRGEAGSVAAARTLRSSLCVATTHREQWGPDPPLRNQSILGRGTGCPSRRSSLSVPRPRASGSAAARGTQPGGLPAPLQGPGPLPVLWALRREAGTGRGSEGSGPGSTVVLQTSTCVPFLSLKVSMPPTGRWWPPGFTDLSGL